MDTANYSTVRYLQQKVRRAATALPQQFDSIPQLEAYRAATREKLARMLALPAPGPRQPDFEVACFPLGEDITHSTVAVCVDEDYYANLHIYRPAGAGGPLPSVLLCPGYLQPKNSPDTADLALALARAGHLAAAVDYTATGECASRPEGDTDLNNAATLALMLGSCDVGLRVAHNLAALRYLKARADVDPARIGITGLCQGGIVLWYTAALCDDFAAMAPVCGTTTLEAEACEYAGRQGGWSGASPFVPGILQVADVGQLYAMLAPRPLLVQNNIADMHWPMAGLEKVRRIATGAYRLYGAEDQIHFRLEHEPHAFTGRFISNLVGWFGQVL